MLTARIADGVRARPARRPPDGSCATAPVLKHFLAYNNEDDRCATSSDVRVPRVLHEYELRGVPRPRSRPARRPVSWPPYNLVNGRPVPRQPADRGRAAPLGRADRARAVRGQRRGGAVQPGRPGALLRRPRRVARRGAQGGHGQLHRPRHRHRRRPIGAAAPRRWTAACSTEADVDRAVGAAAGSCGSASASSTRDLDPYAGIGAEVIDLPGARAARRPRGHAQAVVLLQERRPAAAAGPRAARVAVIGPLADRAARGLVQRHAAVRGHRRRRGCVDGSTRVHCARRGPGRLAAPTDGASTAAVRGTTGRLLGDAEFDVTDWGDERAVTRCRCTRCGHRRRPRRHVRRRRSSLAATRPRRTAGSCTRRSGCEPVADGDAVLLRNVLTGRYVAVDPDGRVAVTAETPDGRRALVARSWCAAARRRPRAAAAAADVAVVVVLGNHPLINGRETQDRTGTALPPRRRRCCARSPRPTRPPCWC